jgi:hypothetical protein
VAIPVPATAIAPSITGPTDRQVTRTDIPVVALDPGGLHSNTAQVPLLMTNTGVVPTGMPPARTSAARRTVRAPLALRILVAVVAVAVLAGLAGLMIHRYEPHWLDDSLGITQSQHPTAQGAGPAVPSTSSTTTTVTPSFTVTTTSPDTASLSVRAPTFLVQVTAAGNPSWIQATTAGKPAPTFSGLLTADQSRSFSVQQSLSIEVGSIAAHIVVSVGHKTVGSYVPPAAPYTMTFRAVS